jgi:hypothetical protein
VALRTAIGQAEVAGCNKSFLQGLKPLGCRQVMSELELRPPKSGRTTAQEWDWTTTHKKGRTIKRNWGRAHECDSEKVKSAPLEPQGAAPNNRLNDQSAEAGFAFPEKWTVIRNPFVPS